MSNLTVPRTAYQSNNRKNATIANDQHPQFPFAPQMSNQTMNRSKEVPTGVPSQNPFHSPTLSATPSTDDEGSSSGQEEFHLERYSEASSGQRSFDNNSRTENKPKHIATWEKKRPRPELNIFTGAPETQARACAPGLVVEQVTAKKAAKFRPKSVVSQKPVIEYHSSPALPSSRYLPSKQGQTKTQARGQSSTNKRSDLDRRPIVIGISIPEDHARAHALESIESAVTLQTPTTPAIVVTPADEVPWRRLESGNDARSVSNFNPSNFQPSASQRGVDRVPPVPRLPFNFNPPSMPERVPPTFDQASQSEYPDSNHKSYDNSRPTRSRRFSSESQEHILTSGDSARPRSKGWWSLALSPMLSRAGTLKSIKRRDSDVPPVPSLEGKHRSRSSTMESDTSPETPRRLGLASTRASTWSRWTTWEKQKDEGERAVGDMKGTHESDGFPQVTNSRQIQAALPDDIFHGHGLAAEYYHACAVDQLSGNGYFECQNHSCAEKLPGLQSVFDRSIPNTTHGTVEKSAPTTFGAVVVPDATDSVHQRSLSETSDLQSPEYLSPNVREANTTAIMRAKTVETPPATFDNDVESGTEAQPRSMLSKQEPDKSSSPSPIPVPMPMPEPSQDRRPNLAAIVPPEPFGVHAGSTVLSPGPVSPEVQRTMTSQGAVPMSEIARDQPSMAPQTFYSHYQHNYHATESYRYIPPNDVDADKDKSVIEVRQKSSRDEKEKTVVEKDSTKPGIMERLKSCIAKRKEKSKTKGDKTSKKRRCIVITLAILLPLMLIGIVVAATQITRTGSNTPTQSQWLNLTGFPPMPTGISTIVRPDNVHSNSQCVTPGTLWSCAVPKENQFEITPNDPNQPNFRFEIVFRNGTGPSNLTVPLSKRAHDPFTNDLFIPNPAPPSQADQIFIGNTTDNITQPFNGEQTPFFMTFIPTFPINPNNATATTTTNNTLYRRAQFQSRQAKNVSAAIPAPDVLDDGTAAPANLLPVSPQPTSQPVRLYNRGLGTEHYGFYMYYDKAIFLSDTSPLDPNITTSSNGLTEDQNGGALRSQAKLRCTFSQTRFLVQMWTNPSFGGHLLAPIDTSVNSAVDYTPPGSFPYPTTITLDRHGGNINKKAAFCYGMNGEQGIEDDVKAVVIENRGVDGTIINPAPDIIDVNGEQDGFDPNEGGIDGGTGGCGCAWQNWN